MRYKLLIFILILYTPFVHSQTGKKLSATIVSNNFALKGIEIVNLDSKNTTVSNDSGVFAIMAKVGEQLMFISKNYEYKTITLKEADFQNANFIINLVKKPEELDEVVISNKIKAPQITNMQALLDKKYPDDKYSQKKNPLINDGTITNGMDFMRIGGTIIGIIKKQIQKGKEKEKKKEIPGIDFKTLVNNNLDSDFFKKTLGLKPEEIDLFLDFCDADPNSKNVLNNPNPLKIMDFLMEQNVAFKKLPTN